MSVKELIELLRKCDPGAEAMFVVGDDHKFIRFVEYNIRGNSVIFYNNRLDWEKICKSEYMEVQVISGSDSFVETTYRSL